ncbi:thiamine pyrophosphate-binding protein [Pendulispora albinea]|uniref:Thiamine pyrophosphate-binding protein n=1 Tax=Pendulispora albinea TaxID=2741071 RepID=A0ABZ2MAT3_9BACT
MKPRVVDFIVHVLRAYGVEHVFGVGGANIEDLYDAMFRAQHGDGGAIRAIVAKHELSAATMADGYSRATNRLGVVMATSGGGAMNLVPGLAEAAASRIPVLALVGQPPTTLEGGGAFQDSSGRAGSLDAARLFGALARFCTRVENPEDIVDVLPRAIAAARGGLPGPAVLLLPKDVQQATLEAGSLAVAAAPDEEPLDWADGDASRARALSLLEHGRQSKGGVLILAGEGVARANARDELFRLAADLDARVAVAPDAKDVFDNRDPRFVGVAGVMGHPSVLAHLRGAALCVLVGTRAPRMTSAGLDAAISNKPLVCFDPEPPFVSGNPSVHIPGPLRAELRRALERLTPRVRAAAPPPFVPPTALPRVKERGARATGPSYRDAVAAIAAALPAAAHVFVDAGNAAATAVHLLPAPRDGRFVVALGMGGMGYTFGAGIGAALGTGRRTYVLAGDGSFFMHGLEVHTAIEYDAPVTFVVLNNNAHAMCATREELFYGGAYSFNRFRPAHIGAGIAAMFPTLAATEAASVAELRHALVRANGTRGPAFVALDLDPDEIPPFAPFLAACGEDPPEKGITDEPERDIPLYVE